MKINPALLAGLLSATAAWAADPADVADPAGALEEAAQDAALEKGKAAVGVPEDTLEDLDKAKDAGEEAKASVADPNAAMDELKGKATDAAIEKAKEAIPAPPVPKLP